MHGSISRGANVFISRPDAPLENLYVKIGWQALQGFVLDASAFLLTTTGRVRSDEDFIFYNQKADKAESVMHTVWDETQGFQICLPKIPSEISRIAFCLTIDLASERNQCFENVHSVNITVWNQRSLSEIVSYDLSGDVKTETAIILGELYKHTTGWKFRAVGQGYDGGLAALATGYGVDIEQPTSQPANSEESTADLALSVPKQILELSSLPLPASQIRNATHCVKCGKQFGYFLSGNQHTGRCKGCDQATWNLLGQFRQLFLRCCEDGILTHAEWLELFGYVHQHSLNWNEALGYVRGDALYFLERQLAIVWDDGVITDEEFKYVYELQRGLGLPTSLADPILRRLDYLKQITEIRRGVLPNINTTTHLESDEICYLETSATYHKVLSRKIERVPGRLVASSKKLHFLSSFGGWTIAWKNIMHIGMHTRSIYIELTTKRGNGRYDVEDSMFVEAVLSSITKINKRALLIPHDEIPSHHIPQPVKIAVWQRDQGKCVQCAAKTYLEYDHIIPRSKGGSSTENNVQLLCRRCNLLKGDRI